jgi:hypothetical protein
MALKDFEAFCREKLLQWDSTQDVSPGSPLDTKLIQPLLGRIGTDPFSTNLPLFVRERLAQEFPQLALKEGDALIDLLVKGTELLLDPITRETNRIALGQSFRDPNLLTTDEAEALGANLFAYRKKGDFAYVTVRVYFATPRDKTVSPADYAMSKNGLLFYPTSKQSIKSSEMLYNQEGSVFYFDVALVSEAPGDQYSIGPGEIVSMPTITDAARVTNKARASGGIRAETAPEFITRAEQELSEKSLNAIRGIVSRLTASFPAITRIAVVGYRDPEMLRDEVVGGSVGSVASEGWQGNPFPDGKNGAVTLRLRVDDNVDFRQLIAAPGPVDGFTVTLVNAWGPGVKSIRDIEISQVLDDKTLELAPPAQISVGSNRFQWALRQQDLTLSGIPGGIIFPDGPTGTVSIAQNGIHIGGCTDVYIKGAAFDSRSLTIDDVADDNPMLFGRHGQVVEVNWLALEDFWDDPATIGSGGYSRQSFSILETDTLYRQLESAVTNGHILDIIYPAAIAGKYKVTRIHYGYVGSPHSPVLEIKSVDGSDMDLTTGESVVWKIQDVIDVELTEPKEQKWEGYDLQTYVGTNIVDTAETVDFDTLGVSEGDVLRILDGNDKGDHVIEGLGGAFNGEILLSLPLKSSAAGLHFVVFRANKSGGLDLPLVRVTEVDLLDAGSQPMGSTVPFGAPVFCLSEKFSDGGIGTKVELLDACCGIVGGPLALDTVSGLYKANVGGKSLRIGWMESGTLTYAPIWQIVHVNFSAGPVAQPIQSIVDQINTALKNAGAPSAAYILNGNRIGIAPIAPYTWVDEGRDPATLAPSCYVTLFGDTTVDRWRTPMTSRDLRSDYISNNYQAAGWGDPRLNIQYQQDAVDLVTGVQVGHYGLLQTPWSLFFSTVVTHPAFPSMSVVQRSRLLLTQDLNPEEGLHVRVGNRSIGWARVFFLDPVTIEFGTDSRFTVQLEQGGQLQFMPDPWINAVRIPAHPAVGAIQDGVFISYDASTQTGEFQSTTPNAHFLDSGIRAGDILTVTCQTIVGEVVLADQVVDLAGKTLVMAVNDSSDTIVTFTADPNLATVTVQHVADQINRAVGLAISSIDQANRLTLSGDYPIVVRQYGSANALLGLASSGVDVNNQSTNAGTYLILEVTSSSSGAPPVWWEKVRYRVIDVTPITGLLNQHFTVSRPGTQRIGSTEMAANKTISGLYYFDVQLASVGIGPLWNISDESEMKTSGFFTYGYSLFTNDPNMTFSMGEKPWISLPAVYFPVGTSDDLSTAVNLAGQNLQINFDSSALIEEVQNFMMDESERVTCYSPLVRHLVPFFTRLDVTYDGGSKASIVQTDAVNYIRNLYPSQPLDAANVQKLVTNRGATSVDNPVDCMAVVHQVDRTVWMEWSRDRVNATGRLAAFFPDVTTFTRRTA